MSSLAPASDPPAGPARPGERGGGWTLIAVVAAALGSAALLLWAVGDRFFAGAFLAGLVGAGAILLLRARFSAPKVLEPAPPTIDVALLRRALDSATAAVAVTDEDGAMIAANDCYAQWFDAVAPVDLPLPADPAFLSTAAAEARRDGGIAADQLRINGLLLRLDVDRAGFAGNHLVWKFSRSEDVDLVRDARRLITGEAGHRVGEAGVMAALADGEGKLITANRAFVARAVGQADAPVAGTPLVNLLAATDDGQFHFAHEGKGGSALRIVQIPVADGRHPLTLFLLLDDLAGGGRLRAEESASINALLDFLPLGLALVNVDGRFVYLNKAFRKAAGVPKEDRPLYPGDLVVDEDKAPLSDAVRRFARGPATSSDMAVRRAGRADPGRRSRPRRCRRHPLLEGQ